MVVSRVLHGGFLFCGDIAFCTLALLSLRGAVFSLAAVCWLPSLLFFLSGDIFHLALFVHLLVVVLLCVLGP